MKTDNKALLEPDVSHRGVAMLNSPTLESAAHIIAENVVSAVERECNDAGFDDLARETVVARLLREILFAMPTRSSKTLATACNRALDNTAGVMGLSSPRVEAVDPNDGSVTMRGA
ncbi:hypothetical protein FV242_23340 [Methylobacterium sp. WL64]|uniref:hypothetical protein n=1 Tax=Methylobacterium sp. WL64 TaxID=2603894 RepID=UPI0011C95743|nr:hypothetical protein [Methylobacterium sp. WL64]TXN00060.1 hypothetical protein FV242_23340 [Methylobacterium sp. WL64]